MASIFRPCMKNQNFSERKKNDLANRLCFFGRDTQEYRVYKEKQPNI